MKFVRAAIGAAVMLAVTSIGLKAQTISVQGFTQGCFDIPCTPRDPNEVGYTVFFTGSTFDWSAVANTPQTVNLGTLLVSGDSFYGLGGFDTDFLLRTTITDPSVTPGSGDYVASLNGSFTFVPGNLGLDFYNAPKKFDFNGGSLFLSVNDLTFDEPGSKDITGTLTYVPTTTPEPASLALVGTGLVGLIPLVRRKRK